jgi:hypothetical protein
MKKLLFPVFLLALLTGQLTAQTTLPTFWNFSTPAITSPPTGWITGLAASGTNVVYNGGNTSIGGDNTAARFDATGDFLTIWFAEKPGPLSYYIKGTGISPAPAFTGIFSVQESVDGVTFSNLKEFTTANPAPGGNGAMGASNKFVHTPAASSRYIRFFYTQKLSGSNIALDSVYIKAAPAAATPSLTLKQSGNTILNGGLFVVGNTANTTFSILNGGTQQTLTIDSVLISGNAASDFAVPSMPDPVAAGGSGSLLLNFTPAANGSRKAVMKIYNNDPDRNPFVVNLYGIGGNLASEPAAAPASLTLNDAKPYSFRVAMSSSADAEKYIVLRKTGGNFSDAPADGTSYKVGDYIGSSVVAYVGDSAFSNLRPKYILAGTNYHFEAFGFNGPSGFENYLTSSSAGADITTTGGQPGNYYDGIDPGQSNFVTILHNKINPHDTVFYGYYAARLVSSWLERDTSGGKKVVNCVYTNLPQIYEGQFIWAANGNTAVHTREHTYCQSWMPTNNPSIAPNWPNDALGREYPEYNDMHHLFPTHQVNANLKRSDNPLGMVSIPTYTSPTGEGKLGSNASGVTVYEPRNAHKGDAARALMYMAVCYHGVGGRNWGLPPNANSTSQQSTAVLLDWHQQDPPSPLEVARHELIFSHQKNRNPFIDHPEWALNINFSTMQYITSVQQPVEFQGRIATWPNPSADRIFVDASLHFEPGMQYDFTDMSGRVLSSGILSMAISELDLPKEKGAYILRLHGKSGIRSTRVMKL